MGGMNERERESSDEEATDVYSRDKLRNIARGMRFTSRHIPKDAHDA